MAQDALQLYPYSNSGRRRVNVISANIFATFYHSLSYQRN